MRILALSLISAVVTLSAGVSQALDLTPVYEATWELFGRTGPHSGLDTRQGDRSVVVFDLTGVQIQSISSLSLSVVSVEYLNSSYPLRVEAIGTATGTPLDPFVWTTTSWSDRQVRTFESEGGQCFTSPSTCPARYVGGYGIGREIGDFSPNIIDVTGAATAITSGTFLQLTLMGGTDSIAPSELTPPPNGTQLGYSGSPDSRFPAPVLTIEFVPEPTTALLLGLGLAGLAMRKQ